MCVFECVRACVCACVCVRRVPASTPAHLSYMLQLHCILGASSYTPTPDPLVRCLLHQSLFVCLPGKRGASHTASSSQCACARVSHREVFLRKPMAFIHPWKKSSRHNRASPADFAPRAHRPRASGPTDSRDKIRCVPRERTCDEVRCAGGEKKKLAQAQRKKS